MVSLKATFNGMSEGMDRFRTQEAKEKLV